MRCLKKLASLVHEHKILLALIFIFLLLIPAGIIQIKLLNADREKKLEAFYQEQKEKKAALEKTYDQILKEQTEQQAKELREAQKLADVVDKNFKPNLPGCSKLENRINIVILDNSCSYAVKALGQTNIAAIFISEELNTIWSEAAKALKSNTKSRRSLLYTNTYLNKEAQRYGKSDISIKFSFFGPYKITESLEDVYYRDNMGKYLDVLSATSEKNKVPEQNYDLVHYIYLSDSFGGGAFPDSHRAFTNSNGYNEIGVFIHETLHLFSATDKYNDDDCNTIGRANPFDKSQKPQKLTDIMCLVFPLSSVIINKITAREIGWPN